MKVRILKLCKAGGLGYVVDVDDAKANKLIASGKARALIANEDESYQRFPHLAADTVVAEVVAAAETPGDERQMTIDEAADDPFEAMS